MRLLLDEHLDRKLKWRFAEDIEAVTVGERGWKGKKNGELLQLAQAEFDAFVTMDKSIAHQQNLRKLSLGVVILIARSNRYADVEPLMPAVNEALKTIQPGDIVQVGI